MSDSIERAEELLTKATIIPDVPESLEDIQTKMLDLGVTKKA